MSLPADFDIRYSAMDDLFVLKKWFANPAERNPFPFETDGEMEEVVKNWVGFSRYRACLTGTWAGEPCAFGVLLLMPYRKVAHHAAFYLIVDPQKRRRGIGTSMVRNLLHLAKTRFLLEGLWAELYDPNPIEKILQKQEFTIFARQENFVKIDNVGHARILMEHFF